MTTVNGVTYTWDNNGNLLNDGVNTYAYTIENRLSSITNGGETSCYYYNGLGDRLFQLVDGVTTHYMLDMNAGLTQVLTDGTDTYLYGLTTLTGAGRLGQKDTTTMEFFLGDAPRSCEASGAYPKHYPRQGIGEGYTLRQMTDSTGTLTLEKRYTPFGEVIASTGTGESVYGYTGEVTDPSGLVYLRARYYEPTDGRFISKDIWSGDYFRTQSLNRWKYVEGNPVNYTDTSGRYIDQTLNATQNPFDRFDRTLNYMYSEMVHNSRSMSAEYMRSLLTASTFCPEYLTGNDPFYYFLEAPLTAYWIFFNKVVSGGEWDHKPKIRSLLGLNRSWQDLYYPIRGNDEYEVYYDIWSNIHYGYVGSAIGFDEDSLKTFANMEKYAPLPLKALVKKYFGQYDPGDEISVEIGIGIWKANRYSISQSILHSAILNRLQSYFISQDQNGNGHLDDYEIDPVLGKLLQRGYIKNGELAGDWK